MDAKHLANMANQIARNFAIQGEDVAIVATARHIADFWDPRMKSAILASDALELHPIAAKAIKQMRTAT